MSKKSKDLLDKAATILESRGAEYGNYGVERAKICKLMNTFYPSLGLTENQVTRLIVIMKLARMDTRPNTNEDDVLDLIGYLTLDATQDA